MRLQWVADTRFTRETTRLMSWPDGEGYSCPMQSLLVSLLLSVVTTLVFSRIGCVLSHRSSLTHRLPRFSPRNLCSYVILAVSSLVYAATNTAFFYASISLSLAEPRFLDAAPADARPRTPLIPFCTVQLRTLCAACSLAIFCLCKTSGAGPEELLCFWGFMVFQHAPVPWKGSGNNNNNTIQFI